MIMLYSGKWLHRDDYPMAQLGLERNLNMLYCSTGLGYDGSIEQYSFLSSMGEEETMLFEMFAEGRGDRRFRERGFAVLQELLLPLFSVCSPCTPDVLPNAGIWKSSFTS